MDTIETRLSGRDASIKGITRDINRSLGSAPLARVEVHYSNQSQDPFNAVEARSLIAALLRENGMHLTKVSVRPHEALIDNATGEHWVRLYLAEQSVARLPHSGFMAWLARWFPGLFASKPTPAEVEPRMTPPPPKVTPKITDADAVAYLNKAIHSAAGSFASSGEQALEARIIVRLDYLHTALEPLLRHDIDTGSAAKSIAGMLKKNAIPTGPGFKVSYTYTPVLETESSIFASETDIEVRLFGPTDTQNRVEPSLDGTAAFDKTLFPSRAYPAAAADQNTAMPFRTLKPLPALTLRILGTLQGGALQSFDQPFELSYATLPARFDRKTLELAGFGQLHPKLLSLVSNSCPLMVQQEPDRAVFVLSGIRKDAQGYLLPMYYRRDTLAALVGEHAMTQTRMQLVVNDPHGVQDPTGGGSLPALVIELQLGSTAV